MISFSEIERYLATPDYIPFFFIAFWVSVVYLVSILSGWQKLSNQYPYTGQILNNKKIFQSIGLRFSSNYNGCVIIGGNLEGFYVAVLFFFRPGHKPIFIPWHEITFEYKNPAIKLNLNGCPDVSIRLNKNMEQYLEQIKGSKIDIVHA